MSLRIEKTEYLQPAVLQKLQWRACVITYRGGPQVKFFVDEVQKYPGSGFLTLPDYGADKLVSRTVWLPYDMFGYKPDLVWADGIGTIEKYEWMPMPAETFRERRLWQGIRATWEGTVTPTATIDGVPQTLAPLVSSQLVTTGPQETRELYFPFGSWGYKIAIGSDYTTNGRIIDWQPIQQVDYIYDSIRIVTQCQITYIGGITVQVGRDGEQHGSDKTFAADADSTRHITRQFWVKPGCRANFFQYRQSAGTGKIISLKTNEMRTDQEQPMIEKPEQMSRQ